MADDKKKNSDVDLGEVIQQTLEKVLPASIAAAGAVAKQAAANPRGLPDPTRCSKCGQLLVACKDQHKMVVLWPDDEDAARWYPGVKVNGVRYKSNYPGQPVCVPANFDGEHMTQMFTKNERELRRGKTRTRMSGSVGPGGVNVAPLGPKDYLR